MGFVRDTLGSLTGANQADAAKEGAKAQAAASDAAIQLQRDNFNTLRADQANYKSLGDRNIPVLDFMANWGEAKAPDINVTKYLDKSQSIDPNSAFSQNDPQMQYIIDQQNKAIQESAAAGGKLNSGGTLAEIARQTAGTAAQYSNNRFNQLMALRQNNFSENMQNAGLASTMRDQLLRERLALQNNKYNQIRDLVGIGQNAAALQGSAATNSTNAISQLLGDKANAYAAGQVGAANAKAAGVNNLLNTGMTAAMFFSDKRLKSNIDFIGNDGTHNWYEYDIFGRRERGVMAQEVMAIKPDAVHLHTSGYLMVNYGAL